MRHHNITRAHISLGRHNLAKLMNQVYSIVIAVVTIVTCLGLGYLAIRPPARRLVIIAVFAWQGALVILWAAVAGVTGREGGTGLRVAMALAIVELFTFLFGSVLNGLVLWRGRSVVNRKMNDTV